MYEKKSKEPSRSYDSCVSESPVKLKSEGSRLATGLSIKRDNLERLIYLNTTLADSLRILGVNNDFLSNEKSDAAEEYNYADLDEGLYRRTRSAMDYMEFMIHRLAEFTTF
jgi:hypothetical protein